MLQGFFIYYNSLSPKEICSPQFAYNIRGFAYTLK